MNHNRLTFAALILVMGIAGASQGLTLPLLVILLEQQGVSTLANGLNAAALYIGMLLVSPWLSRPLMRLGYRNTMVAALALVTVSTVLLPVFDGYTAWFVLRMLLGAGDSALHFASVMWITAIAPPERRGRDISLYGLAYGAGFSVGPLGINLLSFGLFAPFLAITVIFLAAFVLLGRLPNSYPVPPDRGEGEARNPYAAVIRLGWLALIPSFLYGYMEASLNGSFPIYALRIGLSPEWVSVILPSFVVGSLLLQLPLGSLSDRIGRRKVIVACATVGGAAFALLPLVGHSPWLMMGLLAAAGAAVGSFYSLGLAYAADILPMGMVPTAGIIASMNFGAASILAPNANALLMDAVSPVSMFYAMAVMLGAFALAGAASAGPVAAGTDAGAALTSCGRITGERRGQDTGNR